MRITASATGPGPLAGRRSRLALILAPALLALLVAGCGDEGREDTPAAGYSGAFSQWLFQTLTLSQDVDGLGAAIAAAEAGDATQLAEELEFLAGRQLIYNQRLRTAKPPPEWQEKYSQVNEALDVFDLATSRFLSTIDSARLADLATQLISERRQLISGVITCYSEAPACEESLALAPR